MTELLANEFGKANVFGGQWFCFRCEGDASPRYAQSDCYILGDAAVLLLEVKLTYTDLAWWQMEKVYAPLLRKLYDRPVSTLQVCKNLALGHPIDAGAKRTPRKLYSEPEPGRFTWHYLGR